MARVLIVDCDLNFRSTVSQHLRSAGHTVEEASTGARALLLARSQRLDLCLLATTLPDLRASDVLRLFRAEPGTRELSVILLTDGAAVEERALAWQLEALDCRDKRSPQHELLRHIVHALPLQRDQLVRIDAAAHRVWVGERQIDLTLLEFRLLSALCCRPGEVLTRAELLQLAWNKAEPTPGRTVDTHIRRLRGKLGPAARCIRTVRGAGYRFRPSGP